MDLVVSSPAASTVIIFGESKTRWTWPLADRDRDRVSSYNSHVRDIRVNYRGSNSPRRVVGFALSH
jgi:hypothetical protein